MIVVGLLNFMATLMFAIAFWSLLQVSGRLDGPRPATWDDVVVFGLYALILYAAAGGALR